MTNILKHAGILVSISFAGSVSGILIIPNLLQELSQGLGRWLQGKVLATET